MKLIRGLCNIPQTLAESVVTIGSFDGVHLGHQWLIQTLVQEATAVGAPSVVLTFHPQPKEFFSANAQPRLMRLSEKYVALSKLGVDYLCVLYFNAALAQMSAFEFVTHILLEKLGMRALVVGSDFCFGHKRQGNCAVLQRLSQDYDFQFTVVSEKLMIQERVSSTRLRLALAQGDMDLAAKLLGRPYALRGKVIAGEKRGRVLGFPTANLHLHRAIVPMSGVFVIRTVVAGKTYYGVANLGVRPTFGGQYTLLEVHLFGFDQSIYGYHLEVEFLQKLRAEKKFSQIEELVAQIHQDVAQARQMIHNLNVGFNFNSK